MYKVFLFLFFVSALLKADVAINNALSGETSENTQRTLKTKKDLVDLINVLKQSATMGDTDSLVYLGTIYLNGITLSDGTKIPSEPKKGEQLLFRASKDGSVKAIIVMMTNFTKNKNVKLLTRVVEDAQKNSTIDLKTKDYYTMLLAGVLLDKNSDDGLALEVSTKWLFKAEKKRPSPKMQFILANLYNKMNNTEAANYYLNKSCSNPSMNLICKQFKSKAK